MKDKDVNEKRPATATVNAAESEASNATNDEEEKSLEEMARKALECPCVAELREGPCGKEFSEAFVCYMKSTAEEKGSDCVAPFLAMQACMEASSELFTKPEAEADGASDGKSDFAPIQRRTRSRSRSRTPPPPS